MENIWNTRSVETFDLYNTTANFLCFINTGVVIIDYKSFCMYRILIASYLKQVFKKRVLLTNLGF